MSEAKKLTNNVGAPVADNQQLRASAARAMGDAPEAVKRRHIENCAKADAAYGAGVAKALGM